MEKNNKYLVSVIVPVYNAEKTLKKCIESILKQTFPNIEIFLINDGSQDRSEDIISKYKEKFPERINLINQENSGASRARNEGLRRANGKYSIFIDSDDYIDSDYVDVLTNSLEREHSECIVSGFRRVNEHGKVLYTRRTKPLKWTKYVTPLMCGHAYKTEALRDNNLFFLEENIGEDLYLNILANLKLNVIVLDYVGYNWLDNSNSISNTAHKGFNKSIRFLPFLEKLNTEIKSIKRIPPEEKNLLEYFFIKTCLYYIIYSGRGVDYAILKEENYKIWKWLRKHYPNYKKNSYISIFEPKGENLTTKVAVWGWVLLQKVSLENAFLWVYSKL